jgi:hypothetical protein
LFKLPEDCPFCGEKTEKGYVRAVTAIGWSEYKSGTVILDNDHILIGDHFSSTSVEGRKCPSCKIVLFTYERQRE